MKKFTKCLLGIILSFNLFILGVNSSYALNIDSWAMGFYSNLVKNNCMPEILINNANYKENITRKEFTLLVMTYHNFVKPNHSSNNVSPFKDINNPLITQAANLKIVTGYSDSTFKPDNPINRSEAAVILYTCQSNLGFKYTGINLNIYKDAGMIPNWAHKSVSALSGANIFKGYPGGKFYPQKNITKQEAFSIVNKVLLESLKSKSKLEIAKTDSYMTKFQYDFVLNNIPTKKFKSEDVKNSVNDTDEKIRLSIYNTYIKKLTSSGVTIISSPNLVFSSGYFYYIMGIEKRTIYPNSNEQRVFLDEITLTASNEGTSQKQYSPWFTVE